MQSNAAIAMGDFDVGDEAARVAEWASQSLVYGQMIGVLNGLLTTSAQQVETGTQGLNETFATLAAGAKTQAEQIQKIMDASRELEVGGERFSVQDFLDVFSTTLTNLMEKIVFISEMSMRMAYHLDEATEHLDALESFVKKINKINKETNLLALNATIESARFGAEGQGFGVVAGEVKSVSKAIHLLTSDMNHHIGEVSSSLRASYDVTQKLATTDMTENLLAREKLEHLLGGLIAQNQKFTEVMQGAVDDSASISDNISRAVIGMQFQDRNSQQIGNAVQVLQHAMAHLSAPPATVARDEAAVLETAKFISKQFTLSEFRKAFLTKLIADGWVQAEDFADVAAAKAGSAAEDDVELF